MIFYRFLRFLGRTYFRLRLRIRIEGEDFVPKSGPFLLICNHVSDIDPLLTHTFCPRLLFTMAKSSVFRFWIIRFLGPKVGAYPTRRFQVDPQVARVTLRLLAKGQAVGVFPEGERSWDGKLKDLRIGTIKLALKAGVPVIPCGIIGAYEVAPRWGKFNWKNIGIKRETVVIRYGEPFVFGSHDSRVAREKALPAAMEKVQRALERVIQ